MFRTQLKLPVLPLISILALFLCGCHPQRPDSGFLQNSEPLKHDQKVPFNGFWIAPGTDLRTFKKVYVAPVDTSHLLKMDWWDSFSTASKSSDANPESEAKYLATVWHDDVAAAFKDMESAGYQVTDQPDGRTLVIELAITEVVPTKVWLNMISYIAAGAVDNGLTAMEGRFRIGPNSSPIVLFKDAEQGQYDVVSIADMQWYGHSKHTLGHWVDQIAKLCSSAPDAHISSASPFTLRPW